MIVNSQNWPAALIRAMEADPYDRGDALLSVTDLVKPPQLLAIERRLEATGGPTIDARDRLWALDGQALHVILERAGGSTGLRERRLFAEIDGVRVSGQFDVYDSLNNVYFHVEALEGGLLLVQDYKKTSVANWIFSSSGVKGEWEMQLNFLAVLLREHGYRVDRLEVVVIYRDWAALDAARGTYLGRPLPKGATYPESEVAVLPVELYHPDLALALMRKRVEDRARALAMSPEELAIRLPCDREDRWDRGKDPSKSWPTRCRGRKVDGENRRPFCPVAAYCRQPH